MYSYIFVFQFSALLFHIYFFVTVLVSFFFRDPRIFYCLFILFSSSFSYCTFHPRSRNYHDCLFPFALPPWHLFLSIFPHTLSIFRRAKSNKRIFQNLICKSKKKKKKIPISFSDILKPFRNLPFVITEHF